MKNPSLVSLYSGCGGSAYGFKLAKFDIKYVNDSNGYAVESLKENFPEAIWDPANVRKEKKIIPFWEKIKEIDVIEGGFPCQGFSLAGPRQIDDPRNDLYNFLKKAIDKGNPKFFVAENVKGFVSIGEKGGFQTYDKEGKLNLGKVANAIVTDLEKAGIGYKIKCEILNAMDYGLPQDRKRIIIVGVRNNLDFKFEFPKKTHGPGLIPYMSMRDYGVEAIPGEKTETFREKKGKRKDYFGSRYMSRNRIKSWDDVSFTIPADAGQIPADPDSKRMWNKNITDEEIRKVKDSEWTEFRKIHEKDINKKLIRLSWRRCAKIQGFEDDYVFKGDIKSKYRLIGNAVPPPLMEKVADCIMPYFEGKNSSF
ncbi:MAG: DNA cytosine methyltransferase [Candidatus Nitrosopelagicus sp.]|jgi:DNA (cytosine-5)-methyltransferase 1|nr:DNA cytosine methyltransferase [Candidatus Nitrosopelagicus sp.]